MSLRDRILSSQATPRVSWGTYGVTGNPFPSTTQSRTNVHCPIPADKYLEDRVVKFFESHQSQVLSVVGTQGVGKTNFLNYIEKDLQDVCVDLKHHYFVRYIADPEPSFDGLLRTIFQELGLDHLATLARQVANHPAKLDCARSYDLRSALARLSEDPEDSDLLSACLDWLLGSRLLDYHRSRLQVSFRLDTVESRMTVLRDYVAVSANLGILGGIFLLLDELEKRDGVSVPRSVVGYLSALRVIIDALSNHLFLIIAVTPDAILRYSTALPALRSRLEDQIKLSPLMSMDDGFRLAEFYVEESRDASVPDADSATRGLLGRNDVERVFELLAGRAKGRGDSGVPQREFLNCLHTLVKERMVRLSQSR